MTETTTTNRYKSCENCGVQIPALQLGESCGPCLLAFVDSFSTGFTVEVTA
jgi:hypothetical protein